MPGKYHEHAGYSEYLKIIERKEPSVHESENNSSKTPKRVFWFTQKLRETLNRIFNRYGKS